MSEPLYGDECPGVRGNTRPPKFGEKMRGVWAGETNPQRDGYYVETVTCQRRKHFRFTDKRGGFWCYEPKSTVYLEEAPDAE